MELRAQKSTSSPPENKGLRQNPSVIISSLLFSTANISTTENSIESGKHKKENELLNEVVESLKQGGRAVILVPQSLLKSDDPFIIKPGKPLLTISILRQ